MNILGGNQFCETLIFSIIINGSRVYTHFKFQMAQNTSVGTAGDGSKVAGGNITETITHNIQHMHVTNVTQTSEDMCGLGEDETQQKGVRRFC